ncbi:MAG: hypothetical protein WKG07_40070 [Hymenobacter sp.]
MLEWARWHPTAAGRDRPSRVHDLKGAAQLTWSPHWTYIFDRAYLGFGFLATSLRRRRGALCRALQGASATAC